jgi:hypothetical protein
MYIEQSQLLAYGEPANLAAVGQKVEHGSRKWLMKSKMFPPQNEKKYCFVL